MKRRLATAACLLALLCSCGEEDAGPGNSVPSGAGASRASWQEQARQARAEGVAYLESRSVDGKWSFAPGQPPSLGITGLAALGILRARDGRPTPNLDGTLEWIAGQQKPDGSIHTGQLATYGTAIAILVLKESGKGRYASVVARALEYLRLVQLDGGEGYEESSEYYGGVGYEKKKNDPSKPNPNLSTTAWAVEAASAAGLQKDDDFYAKALVFLQRSQNQSETNDRVHEEGGQKIEPGNDGGAYYQPWASRAGVELGPDGRRFFRSYGSMSYALLKSYLFCDLDIKDPRVRAVMDWLEEHWKVETNPGMEHLEEPGAPYKGLYYYWLTLGRTLGAAEKRGLDLSGTPMAGWREQVARAVAREQRDDGSWVNHQNSGWWESSPLLTTSYSVLVLDLCLSGG